MKAAGLGDAYVNELGRWKTMKTGGLPIAAILTALLAHAALRDTSVDFIRFISVLSQFDSWAPRGPGDIT
jgi:hypothetical protein